MNTYLYIGFLDNDFMFNDVVFETIRSAIEWSGYENFLETDIKNIKPFVINIWNSLYNIQRVMDVNSSNAWWKKTYPDKPDLWEEKKKTFEPHDITDYLDEWLEMKIVTADEITDWDNCETVYIPLFEGRQIERR